MIDLTPQPQAQARALPAAAFVDADLARVERDLVLMPTWHVVAHASQLAAPGDHVACEVAGVPLVLVRGADHTLRALHNVCRHRGGPLVDCNGRAARALHCRYHGWTYELDGALRAAPEMQDAADFDRDAICLPRAHCAEWRGLVFAAVGDKSPVFADQLAGIDARLEAAGYGVDAFAGFDYAGRQTYDVACNWKLYIDNYLEGYHVPHVHPALNRVLDTRQYRTQLFNAYSLQSSPLRDRDGEALYYWLWPATMLNCLPDRLQTNRVIALAPDRCRVVFDYFYAPHVSIETREADRAFSDEVQREDVAICQAVQRGVESGSYVPGRLNPSRETALWHFHELWRAALRGQPDAALPR